MPLIYAESRALPQLSQINLAIITTNNLMQITGVADVNKYAYIANQVDGHAVAF
jgi:hypothetical protein